jgi:membrane-associated phospholipid phosphatase
LNKTAIASIYSLFLLSLAAVTPLSASESEVFPYHLDLEVDAALLATGAAATGASLYLYSIKPVPGRWEILSHTKNSLNRLDRQAVGRHLRGAVEASDALAIGACVSPLLLSAAYVAKNENINASTLTVMYAEVAALLFGINGLCKDLVHRDRPYLYVNNPFERSPRNRFSASSFYSLHTTLAFGSMTFLSTLVGDLYAPWLKYAVLAGSLSVAGLTGYFRFASGTHFPTDIIAGAAVGGIIGYLIPAIHKLRSDTYSVSVILGENNGLRFGLRF